MSQTEKVRDRVQEAYAEAVTTGTGCCSTSSCCGAEVEQKGVAAKLAGYSSEELASLPEETVVNSFGCGNPVAFADIREGETVLDLGSGAGIDLLLAAQKVGPTGTVIGVEMLVMKASKPLSLAILADPGLASDEMATSLILSNLDWLLIFLAN